MDELEVTLVGKPSLSSKLLKTVQPLSLSGASFVLRHYQLWNKSHLSQEKEKAKQWAPLIVKGTVAGYLCTENSRRENPWGRLFESPSLYELLAKRSLPTFVAWERVLWPRVVACALVLWADDRTILNLAFFQWTVIKTLRTTGSLKL